MGITVAIYRSLNDSKRVFLDDGMLPFQKILLAQAESAVSDSPATGDGGAVEYDNGNDPSKVRKRFTFRNDYTRFGSGLKVNTTSFQASFPILQEEKLKANFGFDLPLNYYAVSISPDSFNRDWGIEVGLRFLF